VDDDETTTVSFRIAIRFKREVEAAAALDDRSMTSFILSALRSRVELFPPPGTKRE
jgi:uncharacterized protein (DUF1778 family)